MKNPRWIIVVTAEDGGTEAFGPWRDYDAAAKHADQLRSHSRAYTGNPTNADYRVDLNVLKRWPGIREYLRSF
jgi:hypothetical protein